MMDVVVEMGWETISRMVSDEGEISERVNQCSARAVVDEFRSIKKGNETKSVFRSWTEQGRSQDRRSREGEGERAREWSERL